MKRDTNDPVRNTLPPGIKDEDVQEAVTRSGYPLQLEVGDRLAGQFNLTEEWCFVDTATHDLRALDILAERRLYGQLKPNNLRVRPALSILVECKRSDLPFIFFLSTRNVWLRQFPIIAGLFKCEEIKITTSKSRSTWAVPIVTSLSLEHHPFVSKPPYHCFTFSKVARKKGSGLELTGAEPYQSITLPLLKGLSHHANMMAPPSTAMYFDCHLVVGLCVLDAPMIGISINGGSQEMTSIPWVRLIRNETQANGNWHDRRQSYALDIVHADYLTKYIDEHLLPFAEEFSVRAIRHQIELASGKGYAPDMETLHIRDLDKRLRPTRLSKVTGGLF